MDALSVEPERLRMSADRMDAHRTEHVEVHSATNSAIEASATGWVGSSAAALQAKMTDWAAQSLHVENELTHHRDAFDQCGHAYTTTDEQSKINIFRTRLYPGASALANYSVNGNVVVQPGAAGPSVGGQMASFPAFEAYHDTPSGGTSQLAQVWPPGRADQLGPMTGLPFIQDIGDQGVFHSMDGARMTELAPPDSRMPTVTPAAPPPPQTPVPRTEIGK
ncbi:polymorphic toxin protein with WXG100 motif [Mycobacterium phage prophiT36-2a]|nr:WXG100 family type VII secretion target [Mycobacteroides abscessus]MDB2211796.1 WXG100 family type VII secretion target [Mycobacteroides abscessus subsp. massiliense]MDB2235354.1 WXG100 family type VII secretion target [Mycobacteroides abscessus subsp. massiliense]WJJ55610.1 polymorphic toxin protein with WXG100 motif [Mycobacterium phage prophiT36-2a]